MMGGYNRLHLNKVFLRVSKGSLGTKENAGALLRLKPSRFIHLGLLFFSATPCCLGSSTPHNAVLYWASRTHCPITITREEER
jgi:hypothetical protein